MKTRRFLLLVVSLLGPAALAAAEPPAAAPSDAPAIQAVSEDPAVAAAAIAELRAQGPAGLEALLASHAAELAEPSERLRAALDAVAAQKDAHTSRLYWYTDAEAARAAARASGKPILALRLLGRLDEDCSCANSRFFRTALYANREVSAALRERFVLLWTSVRPVPKITIDFGDGRKIERTVTGNSIHYVLDAEGRPVDALPGLYGPAAFLRALAPAEAAARAVAALDAAPRNEAVLEYHRSRLALLEQAWNKDLALLGRPGAEIPNDDFPWAALAAIHQEDARLDAGSVALVAAKHPTADEAMGVAVAKMALEDPLVKIVRAFERSIAEDTVRNEYRLHRTIHGWFARGEAAADLDALNERVYAELFLTPSSDPWLGLVPPDVYAALDGGGITK